VAQVVLTGQLRTDLEGLGLLWLPESLKIRPAVSSMDAGRSAAGVCAWRRSSAWTIPAPDRPRRRL